MNTHEALRLAPLTRVEWRSPWGESDAKELGTASRETPGRIRIIWDSPAEPDSLLLTQDRLALAAIKILDEQPEDI